MIPLRLLVLLALTCGVVLPRSAVGQSVRIEEGQSGAATERLADLLKQGDYLLIERDTVLPDSFRSGSNLVIVGAEVRLEGTVDGDAAVVGGTLFLRPGARIAGDVLVVGGELYPSALATTGEIVRDPYPTIIARDFPGGYTVRTQTPPSQPVLFLPGLFGFGLPTYNRVDGVAVRWGPALQLPRSHASPVLRPWLTYRSARGELDGGATLDIPLRGGYTAIIGAARETVTNDEWIRGALVNSLSSLFVGSDYRNYYRAERLFLRVGKPEQALIPGEAAMLPRFGILASRDRSLDQLEPWALLGGDLERDNPAINPGTLVSVTAGAELQWVGNTTGFVGSASLERGLGWGDFTFTQLVMDGGWEMDALWGHRLSVDAHGMIPLEEAGVPRQRWSILGGLGTLPTYDIGRFRGDNLGFVQSRYGIPLPWLVLPLVGSPDFELVHAAGMAWPSDDAMPEWEQNLGAGLSALFVNASIYINPAADDLDLTFTAGASLPTF